MNVTTDELLGIIGAKEAELFALRRELAAAKAWAMKADAELKRVQDANQRYFGTDGGPSIPGLDNGVLCGTDPDSECG